MEIDISKPRKPPLRFNNCRLTINGGVFHQDNGVLTFGNSEFPLPYLPPRILNSIEVVCDLTPIARVEYVVSLKERTRRMRKLDWHSRVSKVKRGLELRRRRKDTENER